MVNFRGTRARPSVGIGWNRTARAIGLLALMLQGPLAWSQVLYTYDNSTSANVANNGCPTLVTRTFSVSEAFTVGGSGTISIGVDILNLQRGDLNLSLQAPDGSLATLAAVSGDTDDHYRVTFSSNNDTGTVLDDGDADPVAAGGLVPYRRLVAVAALDTFYTGTSAGTWTLRMCDDGSAGGGSGTFNSARLTLRNDAATAPARCASTSSFDWGANGQVQTFSSIAVAPDLITLSEVSNSGEAPTDPGGIATSFITRITTQGNQSGYYTLAMDTTGDTEITAESVTFGFSAPVTGLSFDLLDVDRSAGDWEDYVQVSATGPTGRVPYERTLVATSNTANAGDWVEADTSAATTSTDGNVSYEFLEPVSQVQINYAQGDEPNADSVFQIIGIGDFSLCAFDYGDAPASYGTLLVDNGPRHGLRNSSTLFIGSLTADGETNATATSGATGDNASLNDDEDGVSFPAPRVVNQGWVCGGYTTSPLANEYCVTVDVTNNSGSAAQLVAWIDFNNDGDFTDPGERSLPDLQSTSTTGFNTGNIANGSTGLSAVLVFSLAAPIPNNAAPSVARARLTTDATFFSDGTPPSHLGLLSDGEVEDQAIPINTLPVTLASVSVVRLNPTQIALRWSTATEAGTIGFRARLQDANGSVADEALGFVMATGVDSLIPQYYELIVPSSSSSPVYLEEIASSGKAERFGPYPIGSANGDPLEFVAAPWAQARGEQQVARADADDQRLALQQQASAVRAVEILVSESGLQQISLSDLQAIGINLTGNNPDDLRLSHNGQEVPFGIDSDQPLSAASVIEFYGDAVEGSQYSTVRPYLLTHGAGQGARWIDVSAAPQSAAASDRLRRDFILDADRYYSFSAPGVDPWYFDTVQRNGGAGSKSWTLATPGLLPGRSALHVDVWGGIDYPGVGDDHRYSVSINGTVLGERRFNGVKIDKAAWPIPAGVLNGDSNIVEVQLIDTGFPVDILRVERIRISAMAELMAGDAATGVAPSQLLPRRDGITLASFEDVAQVPVCGDACEQIKVSGLPDNDVVALQFTDQGVNRLRDFDIATTADGWSALLRVGQLNSLEDLVAQQAVGRLVVVSRSQAKRPQMRPADLAPNPLSQGSAELLVLAPSRFMAAVEPLLQARRAEGLSARAVDVDQVYAHYSAGIVDPLAIKRFLAEAREAVGVRYVLLVGGDTYDYYDRLGLGSVSDIPTLYGRTHPVVNHAPLDSLFVDFDNDGAPELAIGRLPVRTAAELNSMLQKVIATPPADRSVLLVAERSNPAEGANYAAELDDVAAQLPAHMQSAVDRVYLDNYALGATGVGAARSDLVDAVNGGAGLVSYFGHGSPTVWSREQLLQGHQVPALINQGVSPVVSEFGCWGGYFVAPHYNTMTHGWIGQPSGAVAMFASSGLTEHTSDKQMASVLLPLLGQEGLRIGDALVEAKQTLNANQPELVDILRGMTLFGDPSMRVSQRP